MSDIRANIWSAETIAAMKSMWAAGASAREISARIGKSRNAILGKIYRLGVEVPKERKAVPAKTGPKRKRVRKPPAQATPRSKVRLPPSLISFLKPDTEAPKSKRLPIWQLEPHTCRYPTHDDPYLFCGHKAAADEIAWCPYHLGIVYRRFNLDEGRRAEV